MIAKVVVDVRHFDSVGFVYFWQRCGFARSSFFTKSHNLPKRKIKRDCPKSQRRMASSVCAGQLHSLAALAYYEMPFLVRKLVFELLDPRNDTRGIEMLPMKDVAGARETHLEPKHLQLILDAVLYISQSPSEAGTKWYLEINSWTVFNSKCRSLIWRHMFQEENRLMFDKLVLTGHQSGLLSHSGGDRDSSTHMMECVSSWCPLLPREFVLQEVNFGTCVSNRKVMENLLSAQTNLLSITLHDCNIFTRDAEAVLVEGLSKQQNLQGITLTFTRNKLDGQGRNADNSRTHTLARLVGKAPNSIQSLKVTFPAANSCPESNASSMQLFESLEKKLEQSFPRLQSIECGFGSREYTEHFGQQINKLYNLLNRNRAAREAQKIAAGSTVCTKVLFLAIVKNSTKHYEQRSSARYILLQRLLSNDCLV